MRRLIVGIMIAVLCLTAGIPVNEKKASASAYVTVNTFAKMIVKELGLETNGTAYSDYINALINVGILKSGEIKNAKASLTRTDCAVIVNRMDEYVNEKYGIRADVYELLKDCLYYEGRLYYNIKGKLYKQGEPVDLDKAAQFYEDVIKLSLIDYFNNDSWSNQGIRTGFDTLYDGSNGVCKVYEWYITIGVVPSDINNTYGVEKFDDNSEIVTVWNKIQENERRVRIVLEKRISDIKKISSAKREAVAAVMAKGIIVGKSNGLFVQSRTFGGTDKMTTSEVKTVLQRVMKPSTRKQISPEGELIRTTNLPKNASDYPYILECFPNAFYEMKYNFMYYKGFFEGKTDKSLYAYPKTVTYEYLNDKCYERNSNLSTLKYQYFDETLDKAEKYLNLIFNVNYKTIGSKWAADVTSTYYYSDDRRYENAMEYVDLVKKNHIVLESKLISLEPSTMYYSANNYFIRAYVKYKITADDITVDPDDLIYSHDTYLRGLKNGKWRYAYYDIEVFYHEGYDMFGSTAVWGVDDFERISDYEFLDKLY